ncbi:MAG: META domain-containing protein [Acidimicrobiales bacterium]
MAVKVQAVASRGRFRLVAASGTAVFAALLLIGGCGRDDASPDAEQGPLDGRVFLAQSAVGRELVPGSTIRLAFDRGQLSATAGCNSLGAPYRLADDRLVVRGGVTMTEIGCDAARHLQDQWLADVLQGVPRVALDGATLTLTTADATLHLLDRTVAGPDRPLVGTRWQVDTVLRDGVAASVPEQSRVTLEFGDDGTLVATSPGCTSAHLAVTVGPLSMRFGDVTIDSVGCPRPWAATVDVIRAADTSYTITGARLTIRAADIGIVAVAPD